MQTRRLGSSGVQVGAIGLGCMGMSWAYGDAATRSDDESVRLIHRAIDLGVTLLDTADMYGPWHNEQLVGRAIEGRRDDVFLATKCGLVVVDPDTTMVHTDGRPMHIRMAIEASLRRLRTDHIDLYQLHRPDPTVPVAESIGAMGELVTAGKVRYIGVSEMSVTQLAEAHATHPITTLQSEMSLWTQGPLADVMPWCEANDVAFLPFAPLGRGFLTGALDGQQFSANDFRSRNPRFTDAAREQNATIVERVRALAAQQGCSTAQLSLAWLLAQSDLIVPIPGTKQMRYLEDNCAAAEVELQPAIVQALNELPPPTGNRY
jgi:aryl-alcohol dehydrogenase-like predicted oxidoreductase